MPEIIPNCSNFVSAQQAYCYQFFCRLNLFIGPTFSTLKIEGKANKIWKLVDPAKIYLNRPRFFSVRRANAFSIMWRLVRNWAIPCNFFFFVLFFFTIQSWKREQNVFCNWTLLLFNCREFCSSHVSQSWNCFSRWVKKNLYITCPTGWKL